jgi:ABC-type Fe3+/spermidine/putrescine transport system ATPase subunit
MTSPTTTPIPVVEVREVTRSFGATRAVAGVSLEIFPGEIFGLLGPSGCGKTTLLRLIAGLDRPDTGTVMLGGRDVTHEPAHRRDVHTVFQSYALFPRMSVQANVEFGLRTTRLGALERRERVASGLKLVGLEGKEKRRPHELSGGEQQRVALARALVNEPPVLLLDEPLAALDAHLRREMQAELRRIQLETQCTFILVTHDQDEAFSLCDRVAVMFNGRLAQLAPPEELYRRPTSVEVAHFIGRSSLLPATWSQGKAVISPDWSLPAYVGSELAEGVACTLVLRPRQIRLHPVGTNVEHGIPGRIEHVAFAEDWFEANIATALGTIRAESGTHPGPVGSHVVVSTDHTDCWVLPS